MRRLVFVVTALVAGVAALSWPGRAEPAANRPLRVVVTIKPIHSLAASLLEGVAEPVLLVEGQASPHSFSLKPSAARAAHEADVLVRVSETVEPFSRRLVATLPASVGVVTLVEAPGIRLLPLRTGDTFEAHEHGADTHDSGHAREHERGHDHQAGGDHSAGRDASAGGAVKPGVDGHIWLDPDNARRIVAVLAEAFARRAPTHAGRITANAEATTARIAALEQKIAAEMEPLRGRPFIVFHDATQYFERRFGLEASGAITVSPDVQPSGRRLKALRQRIAGLGAVCVFAEPQFRGGILSAVVEGSRARSGVLDPEGALLAPGPDLYAGLIRGLAASMSGCLSTQAER